MNTVYHDIIIVGAGPAGLAAAIYATRAMSDALALEQTAVGGQVITTTDIDNYPGAPQTNGFELMQSMEQQARDLGAQIQSDKISAIEKNPSTQLFELRSADDQTLYTAKAVIYAAGATPRRAGFTNEQKFTGQGISYCGTCDGMFYRGKTVFVIGGGNTAVEEALFLTRFATQVVMIVRKDHLRASQALIERLKTNEKVSIRYNTSIVAVHGEQLLTSIDFKDEKTAEISAQSFDEGSCGIFVFAGQTPASEAVKGLVELTDAGAIKTDVRLQTKTAGLFAAGDVRDTPLRQIITAAADGALAASGAAAYVGSRME